MGLGWTHSPKSVFPVFFLIVLEGIFNLVSIIAIFKGQTWKERKKKKKTGNKPGALTVQDGIGMKECRDENLLTAIYIIRRENLTHFGA